MSVVVEQAERASAEQLLAASTGRGAIELADGIRRLIASGELRPGMQLPTVRNLAEEARVSPGTVMAAWNRLRADGLIETRRRGGTIVLGPVPTGPVEVTWSSVDFLQCAPDITLQPDLSEALLDSLTDASLNIFGREYMTEALRAAVTPTWPFPAEAWATAGGGTEALLLAVAAAAEPGSTIAVHEPASPGLLDTLRALGLTPLAVASDAEGPRPESLAAAFAAGAAAFVFQPGAEFGVTGSVTPRRTAELAGVVTRSPHPVWVVEDDAVGPLAMRSSPSIGEMLPARTVRVRSYCKAYGIDVRTSVIGGSRALVERAIAKRSHGVGSNSRILQNALAHLIRSPRAAQALDRARAIYLARRDTLRRELEDRGLVVDAADGAFVLWVEVADETDALVALAGHGISVAPGSKAFVARQGRALIRISPLQIPEAPGAMPRLADLISDAAHGRVREFFD